MIVPLDNNIAFFDNMAAVLHCSIVIVKGTKILILQPKLLSCQKTILRVVDVWVFSGAWGVRRH